MNILTITLMSTFTFLGLIIQSLFIIIESKKKYLPAVILKGLASICFLSVGIVSFSFSNNKNISILFLIGLILGVFGDILLNLRFVIKNKSNLVFLIGTASFLLGHIFYIIALFKIAKVQFIYAPILIALLICGVIGYFIFKKLKVKNSMKIFGIIYVFIVSLFMSTAMYNLVITQNNFTILSSCGSVLFFLSDVILIFNSFGPNPKLSLRASNLLLYFAGQILIGFSLLYI